MSRQPLTTEAVVRRHLRMFLEQWGVDAIVEDYADDARFYSEEKIYKGGREIRGFFTEFIRSLPPGSIPRFSLRCLQVHEDIAYITWSIPDYAPLGTDTFVVKDGKIVLQTFAMHAHSAVTPSSRSRPG